MDLEKGLQVFVGNLPPNCPQPEHSMGMPPHSDHGLLSLFTQNGIGSFQLQYNGMWINVNVNAMPYSFLVNIANQLEVLAFWIPFSLFYYAIFFPILLSSLSSFLCSIAKSSFSVKGCLYKFGFTGIQAHFQNLWLLLLLFYDYYYYYYFGFCFLALCWDCILLEYSQRKKKQSFYKVNLKIKSSYNHFWKSYKKIEILFLQYFHNKS